MPSWSPLPPSDPRLSPATSPSNFTQHPSTTIQPSPSVTAGPQGSRRSSRPHSRGACLAPERNTPYRRADTPPRPCFRTAPPRPLGRHPATQTNQQAYLDLHLFQLQKNEREASQIPLMVAPCIETRFFVYFPPEQRHAPKHTPMTHCYQRSPPNQ